MNNLSEVPLVEDQGGVLKEGRFQRLAIANPKLAPYGAAAQEALQKLPVWPQIQPRSWSSEKTSPQRISLSSQATPNWAS